MTAEDHRRWQVITPNNITYYISDRAAISEPAIRQSIAKIYTIPRQASLSKTLREVQVVTDIRKRISENKLHNFALAPINGNPYNGQNQDR